MIPRNITAERLRRDGVEWGYDREGAPMRTDLVIALSAAMFIVAADPARAIVFDDGLLHVIDSGNSFPFEGVTLRNGPLSSTTTLELVDGGLIGNTDSDHLVAEENSVVHVFGGGDRRGSFCPRRFTGHCLGWVGGGNPSETEQSHRYQRRCYYQDKQ